MLAVKTSPRGIVWQDRNGECGEARSLLELGAKARESALLVCNRSLYEGLTGSGRILDVLELFGFVCPAQNIMPSIKSLCSFLGLREPVNAFEEVNSLFICADKLIERMALGNDDEKNSAASIAKAMGERGGWAWAPSVLDALGFADKLVGLSGYAVWEKLPEWEECGSSSPAGSQPVSQKEAEKKLALLLQESHNAEDRKEQTDYAVAVSAAFAPRNVKDEPVTVLAEAGTGVGKTLGYIAPASVWADKNAGSVWISTYTKNLQRQLDAELSKLFPAEAEKRRNVVIRKGRENYVCLLNYADAVSKISSGPANVAVPLGFVARWLGASKDGDICEGDFPAWLADLTGANVVRALSEKRGECIYASCPYYKKCFVEKIIRRSRHAKIVVANHALVMAQAAGMLDDDSAPTRYIFDEGHHLFNAADSAFAAEISGLEAAEIKRWLVGAEDKGKNARNKGLERRLEDITITNPDMAELVKEALHNARFLPKRGWLARIARGEPDGSFEAFLNLVRTQVQARNDSRAYDFYGLECEPFPLAAGIKEAAQNLALDISMAVTPLNRLVAIIEGKLNKEALARLNNEEGENKESKEENQTTKENRQRYEGAVRSLKQRVLEPFAVWGKMLKNLHDGKAEEGEVLRFAVEKIEGHEFDVAFTRNYVNPMPLFADIMKQPAHGILITSATLKDRTDDIAKDWEKAEIRTGAINLCPCPIREAVKSPFDYPTMTKVLIVTDVNKNDAKAVASAMRELFKASGGGALGLFTSIERLKAVHRLILPSLKELGINLYAQHINDMNTASIVDMFKDDEDSCLLGTDAVRDGVDIPGRSLRLLVFDRVPWTKPDILHKARRAAFGGEEYEKMLVRGRLAQAYGRLIRTKTDKGALVILDSGLPSVLCSAFPAGVEIRRVNLKETVCVLKEWL